MLGQVVAPARAWLTAAEDPTEPPDPDLPLLPARRRRPELRDTRGSKRRLVLTADHERSATSDGFEVTAAKRVLFENFSCRDNTQLEYCIGALLGSSVTLHNIKIFNSSVRGVEIFNSAALIEGLTIDKTVSTSVLVRGSDVRLEGELTFSTRMPGRRHRASAERRHHCPHAWGVCRQLVQAPLHLPSINTHAGLVLVSQGASFGGSIVAKNNGTPIFSTMARRSRRSAMGQLDRHLRTTPKPDA
jgi:hypothetical protein